MRPVMIYSMLTMAIFNAAETPGTIRQQPALKPLTTTPIHVARLESTHLTIPVNRTVLIESRNAIRQISVENPELIEVMAVNNHELVIYPRLTGETTLVVSTASGDERLTITASKAASNTF